MTTFPLRDTKDDAVHNRKRKHQVSISEENSDNRSSSGTPASRVFDERKKVKRKLDFDDDDYNSDYEGSFQLSIKNLSWDRIEVKKSAVTRTNSILFSPYKNHHTSIITTCSRSSVGSSCRRQLFPTDRSKHSKHNSKGSLLCMTTNSNDKEVRLSLKKKFPGVPRSDSARSGLLLNLAFSKYNLPNSVDGNNELNSEDNGIVNKTIRKEISCNTSMKEGNSTVLHSPVFTSKSFKNVKRKLNLEDRENDIQSRECSKKACDINSSAEEINSNRRDISVEKSIISNRDDEFQINRSFDNKNPLQGASNVSANESTNFTANKERISSPIFQSLNDHQRLVALKNCQLNNDLFKNSKLRSSLRNKIFHLSTLTSDESINKSNTSINANNIDHISEASDSEHNPTTNKRYSLPCNARLNFEKNFNSSKECASNTSKRKQKVKYDRIIVGRDIKERIKKDSERLKRLNMSSKPLSERSANISIKSKDCSKKNCKTMKNNRFIDSHLERFLNDCLKMMDSRNKSTENLSCSPIECSTSIISPDSQQKSSCVIGLNRNVENTDGERELIVDKSDKHSSSGSSISAEISNKIQRCGLRAKCPTKKIKYDEGSSDDGMLENSSHKMLEKYSERRKCIIEDVRTQECNFLGDKSPIVEDVDQDETIQEEEMLTRKATMRTDFEETAFKVNTVSTLESEFNEDANDSELYSRLTPISKPATRNGVVPVQKFPRRKFALNTLPDRLHKLLNREKSVKCVWEYELSKRNIPNQSSAIESMNDEVVFSVEKMWNEFSFLILLCNRKDRNLTNERWTVENFRNEGINVSHSVLLVIEPSFCPSDLNDTSIIRIHPPWRIFFSARFNQQIVLRPCKIEVISKENYPISSEKSILSLNSTILKENRLLTTCSHNNCACLFLEYCTTLMPSVLALIPNHDRAWNFYLRNYNLEDIECVKKNDHLLLIHQMLPTKRIFLCIHVINIIRCSYLDEINSYLVMGENEELEICYIYIKGNMKTLPLIQKDLKFKFTGLTPWKIVPTRFLSTFMESLRIEEYSNLIPKIGNNLVYTFVLSEEVGQIEFVK